VIVESYCNNCLRHMATMDTDNDYRANNQGDREMVDAKPYDEVFDLTNMKTCPSCGDGVGVTLHISMESSVAFRAATLAGE